MNSSMMVSESNTKRRRSINSQASGEGEDHADRVLLKPGVMSHLERSQVDSDVKGSIRMTNYQNISISNVGLRKT